MRFEGRIKWPLCALLMLAAYVIEVPQVEGLLYGAAFVLPWVERFIGPD